MHSETGRGGAVRVLLLVVVAGWGTTLAGAEGVRRALLIGCTEFPTMKELYGEQGYAGVRLAGPANDVPLLRDVLVGHWGFEKPHVALLVGWDAAEATRPTKANIERAFEQLIGETQAGDVVVLYLASHCTQLLTPPEGAPVDPEKDPTRAAAPASARTAERDKYDEVFMPADAGAMDWENRKLENGIFDHQFATWIQALRDRGAFVFAIVNTPHAAGLLDVSPEMLLKQPSRDDTPKALGLGKTAGFAALYACHADEADAAMDVEAGPAGEREPHGALTWALCEALRKKEAHEWSYRELAAAVAEAYRQDGRRAPVPASEGDLDAKIMQPVAK